MPSSITSSITLLLVTIFLKVWTANAVLKNYNLQLAISLIVLLFLANLILPKKQKPKTFLPEIAIFTTLLILILSSTGNLQSPLFFLSYFLIFITAFLLEPLATLTLTFCLFLFFVNFANSLNSTLELFSIVLITPLAIYFSRIYLKLLESQEKIKILKKQTKTLTASQNELTQDLATQETNALLWLSLNFKNSLLKIVHLTSDLLTEVGKLTLTQKEKLQEIHSTAKEILKSGEKLKEKIDKETD